uniref:Uncharacterized protein n=1 Tax=Timema cristinae TaxID=61476 RepID=A0A7R9H9F7_TIMCR|nr:unnamed protein product [Timema cristinae]
MESYRIGQDHSSFDVEKEFMYGGNLCQHFRETHIANKCLEYYNYSSESVIHALLESSLASSLAELDQSLPRIPLEAESKLDLLNSGERSNVFDNDEFDIMTRDYVDTTRIHKGKRVGKHKDLASMLNDKTHVTELGEKFKQLGLVDVYEDEYDDTYDHVDISVDEAWEPERIDPLKDTVHHRPRGLVDGPGTQLDDSPPAASIVDECH